MKEVMNQADNENKKNIEIVNNESRMMKDEWQIINDEGWMTNN